MGRFLLDVKSVKGFQNKKASEEEPLSDVTKLEI